MRYRVGKSILRSAARSMLSVYPLGGSKNRLSILRTIRDLISTRSNLIRDSMYLSWDSRKVCTAARSFPYGSEAASRHSHPLSWMVCQRFISTLPHERECQV